MKIKRIDHLVLTVHDIDKTVQFYTEALGMELVRFGEGRVALRFGGQKINLHESGKELEPKAAYPTPGSADICLITQTPIDKVIEHLNEFGIDILEGPVNRTGAQATLISVYLRDPDGNLIELANEIL